MSPHGTRARYRWGSRCFACRLANHLYEQARRRRWKARGFTGLTHGTQGTYSAGCRCRPCRDANAAKCRDYRARKRAA